MTVRSLLDSSAIIALLRREPGGSVVEEALEDAAMSSVNAAETVSILIRFGDDPSRAERYLIDLGLPIIAFDAAQWASTGTLAARNRGVLSLCLATAASLDIAILTANRAWAGLGLTQDIRLIR
ncbi:PIN domain-containing protein [Plastoroseomonas arctica]|uniref:Type II toxin-antitoxin system VapC family toxin n=1 Tax=Plastoroseomonas arctica TaxID=1509237 RepID=A0AAF1JZ21_9PROT|nr:PIN domain-containing protein [Plastoroseomonas arctica]MBR0656335.1 type II toxin-antitoxin system VapC family toxin [Plastoroseomonas arctica]